MQDFSRVKCLRIVCIYYFCDRNLVKAEASKGYFIMYYIFSECRGVVPGGTGVDMVPPAFGISVNPGLPYLNRWGGGANYAHQIILATLEFQTFLVSWNVLFDLYSVSCSTGCSNLICTKKNTY